MSITLANHHDAPFQIQQIIDTIPGFVHTHLYRVHVQTNNIRRIILNPSFQRKHPTLTTQSAFVELRLPRPYQWTFAKNLSYAALCSRRILCPGTFATYRFSHGFNLPKRKALSVSQVHFHHREVTCRMHCGIWPIPPRFLETLMQGLRKGSYDTPTIRVTVIMSGGSAITCGLQRQDTKELGRPRQLIREQVRI
jgi:hypothetical protein